jgi:hypothetical protein
MHINSWDLMLIIGLLCFLYYLISEKINKLAEKIDLIDSKIDDLNRLIDSVDSNLNSIQDIFSPTPPPCF